MHPLVSRLLAVLVLALATPRGAAAFELLVVSGGSDQVLRFDGATGGFLGVFAEITDPRGIATDGAGLVYVTDLAGVVRQYDETGDLIDFVISGMSGLGNPVVGPDGRLYLSDFFNDVVRTADFSVQPPTAGAVFVQAGSGGLDGPTGLAFGPGGDLFVSSRISGQVIRYDGDTAVPVGVFATPGGSGPQGLAFRPGGDLYVASDSAQAVLRFDGATGAALGVFADPIGSSSDGMKPVFGPDGRLYVSLTVFNEQIERFDGTTGASQGVLIPAGTGGLANPWDFVVVPEPGAAGATATAALALLALRARRR